MREHGPDVGGVGLDQVTERDHVPDHPAGLDQTRAVAARCPAAEGVRRRVANARWSRASSESGPGPAIAIQAKSTM